MNSSIYEITKDRTTLTFQSEMDACKFLGVAKCSVASCYRRGSLCKGYSIKRVGSATHGETKTKLHKRWESMIARCEYKKHPHYKDYGGRGIRVCKDWHFYISFRDWALSNGYSDDLTIDRIDVNGDYEPANCRFVTWDVQGVNKRSNHFVNIEGKLLTISQVSRLYDIPKSTVRWRATHNRDCVSGAKMDEEVADGL